VGCWRRETTKKSKQVRTRFVVDRGEDVVESGGLGGAAPCRRLAAPSVPARDGVDDVDESGKRGRGHPREYRYFHLSMVSCVIRSLTASTLHPVPDVDDELGSAAVVAAARARDVEATWQAHSVSSSEEEEEEAEKWGPVRWE
jgi:hypothetical protein